MRQTYGILLGLEYDDKVAYIFKSSYTAHISNIYQLYERALKEQQGGGWGGGIRGGRGVLGGGGGKTQ